MRKGDYHGAIEEFRLADQWAPHWGLNHLRWGQSFLRTGREREAKAQFVKASSLTLPAAERAQLDTLLGRTPPGR